MLLDANANSVPNSAPTVATAPLPIGLPIPHRSMLFQQRLPSQHSDELVMTNGR